MKGLNSVPGGALFTFWATFRAVHFGPVGHFLHPVAFDCWSNIGQLHKAAKASLYVSFGQSFAMLSDF